MAFQCVMLRCRIKNKEHRAWVIRDSCPCRSRKACQVSGFGNRTPSRLSDDAGAARGRFRMSLMLLNIQDWNMNHIVSAAQGKPLFCCLGRLQKISMISSQPPVSEGMRINQSSPRCGKSNRVLPLLPHRNWHPGQMQHCRVSDIGLFDPSALWSGEQPRTLIIGCKGMSQSDCHGLGIAVSEAWYRNPTLPSDNWRSNVVLKQRDHWSLYRKWHDHFVNLDRPSG